MTVRIRPAQMSDAAEIGRLTCQLGYELEPHVLAARLSNALTQRDQHFAVAELGQHVVGWVHAATWEFLETGRVGIIAGLVVDREHRRSGVGTSLMTTAEAWVTKQGCSVVRLWSSSGRSSAHQFYEALGYTNIKTQYSFAKMLNSEAGNILQSYVPRIDG